MLQVRVLEGGELMGRQEERVPVATEWRQVQTRGLHRVVSIALKYYDIEA